MADNIKYDDFGPGPMGFGVGTPEGKEEGSIVTEVVDSVAEKGGGYWRFPWNWRRRYQGVGHLDHESTVELIIETKRPVVLHFEKAKDAKT